MKAIKNLRRAASLMLALVLLLTMFPVQGTAEDVATPSDLPTAEETVQEEVAEDMISPDTELLPDSTALPEETTEAGDEPPSADAAAETPPAEDTAEDTPTDSVEDADTTADTQDETEQPVSLKDAIVANGFAYVPNLRETKVYNTPELTEDTHIFTLTRVELVLLATDYLDNGSVEVWFLVSADAAMHGYVSASDLAANAPTAAELDDLTYLVFSKEFTTSVGSKPLYLVYGDFVEVEEPTHGETEPDVPADENAAETQAPVENPSEEQPADENAAPEDAEAAESVTDADAAEELPDDYIDPSELPAPDPVAVGEYVTVTTQTRVFSNVDETAGYDYIGDLYQGYFVKEATVRVEAVGEDCCGRWWYEVTYLYGDTFADGRLKWTAKDRAIVLARETTPTDSTELTVTDYAFPKTGVMLMSMAEEPEGFTLKRISGPTGSFTVGQSGLQGSSGRDAEYKQIATLEGHGKIYATPHFLEGYVVYCLEHTLPGPGENISGGGKQPTGPYLIVDWESYQITDGYSGAIYGEDTMHGIAWVLAHGYPFMALDHSDSDNETWSRVATQFAIREVIKQMEGAQYVRDYWQMDNFYAASNNAHAVYLEYARWLARNGIAHARRTGEITVSNKLMGVTDSGYFGSATLTTDADLMRISKNVGTITGNTAGDDDNYYYLNSGDTITIYTTANSFAFKVESMADDEADFLVGVPDAAIQKVLIPIEGDPYPMKEIMLDFRIEHGAVLVTKTDADSGMTLPGATFALLDAAGTVLQTATTDGSGTVTFSNIKAGQYQVQEIGAPTGYLLSVPSTQAVTVTAGATASLAFANEQITSKIRIVKTDAQTGAALPGAVFTVTDANNTVVATLTTGSDGTAVTGWLPYGVYTVTETAAPDHYINGGFSTTVNAHEDGKTYTFDVVNEPMQGGIRIVKTDALDGHPVAGVTFDIYLGSTLIGSMTTNDSGVAVSEALDPGTYTVRERELPVGYVGELVSLEVVVESQVTAEVTATNIPSQSKVRIVKTDSLTHQPLPGATFTITDESGALVATLTTGADGTATSDWLPYGTYIISETAAPDHYVNSGFCQTVYAHENGKTYEFAVENAPTKGGIRLTKTDALDGRPIAGVTFDIYLGEQMVASMTTNESGVAVVPDLEKGSYTIREVALPEGYTGALVELTAEVQSDHTTELSCTNTPLQGKVRIEKKDSLTGEALAGATFTISDVDGSVVETLITDADGSAESGLLRYGEYTITETAAPEHYVNSGFTETFFVSEEGKTYTFQVENAPTLGGIRLTKTDALDGRPLSGVVFDIYQGETLIGSMTTDEQGVASYTALNPGSYTARERSLPTGYTGVLVEVTADVQSDETTELTAVNHPIQGRVKVIKVDSLTGAPLSGAIFTLTDANGQTIATLTTGVNGVAESELLRYGIYTLTETAAPENYLNGDFSETFAITEEGVTITYEVENTPVQGWIRLSKTDPLSGKPIAGVTFDVYQGDALITSMTTNTEGVATSNPLYPGSYTVREHELPTGYAGELVVLDAVVTSANTTELTCTNMPSQSKIRIVKTDSLTHEPLSGAEFTVTDAAGTVVAVLTTGADGTIETDWLRYGVYTVKETATPTHYIPSSYMTTIEAFEDGKTYTLDVENEPTKGFIEIVKIDELTRTPIAGVQFDIYQGDTLVSTMTTNANGAARSKALHKGQYTVREHENPTGYVGVLSEMGTTVRSDETTYLTAANKPIQGRIQIIKTDALTGEKLAGAEFTITRVSGIPAHNGVGDGEVVATITTDADGMAITPLLIWGTYRVEESTVPVHYVDNSFSVDVPLTNDLETVTVDVTNEPTKGWLRLTKTDRLNGNPIAGVQFDIYQGDELVSSMTTDENGVALSEPLRKGQYIVREHGAVDGYVYEEIRLDATVKSDETTELTATNQPVMTRIKLYKRDVDEYNGKNPNSKADAKASAKPPKEVTIEAPETRGDGVLTGTVFQVSAGEDIVDRQGNIIYPQGTVIIESLTTAGEDASVETDLLWPGLYEVQEIAAPIGYQLNEDPFYVDTRSAAYQSETAVVLYNGLSLNEIKYGAISIVKILGANGADPDPTRVETPEKGAKFRVYLKSAGSYEKARKIERDTLTTDAHGYAMTKPLPYGVYILEQTAGKEGYEIKGPIEFEITGEESLVNPPPITLNDQPILYRLKLIKTDAKTGKVITLANTSFKLKDSEGNYVTQTSYYPTQQTLDTFTTDESGTVTLPETVTWGLYHIEEVHAPEGYLIRTESLAVMVGHSGDEPGQTYELDIAIPNEPVMGRIKLEKRGMQLVGFQQAAAGGYNINIPIYDDRYLAGAVFEIRAAEDIVGQEGTVWYKADQLVQTITTTDTGADTSMELPLGKYYLLEVKAPEGYILADTPYEADLTYADDKTPVVEVTVEASNAYLPAEVLLTKEKEVMQTSNVGDGIVHQVIATAPGEGCVFGIYNAKDIRSPGGTLMADSLLATGVTDENGKMTFSGVYPHGDYYVKELSAPDGWKVNPNSYPISITPDMTAEDAEIIRIALKEPIYNEIVHTPVTLTKTDVTGAHTVPGALIEVEDSSGSIIYRAYTDENGEIPDIPVTPGDYIFREVLAPEGYALNTAEMSFSVDAAGNVTGSTTILDDYTRVTLKKVDLNGEPLEGVGFGLYRSGKLLATSYSDADGVVTFTQIPYGDYIIRETRPLSGYMLSDVQVRFSVDGTFVNPDQPLATVENNPIEVIIRKVDKDNKPLAGAVYALVDDTGAQVMTALSDETGTVKFTYVPYGSYTIQEIEAPTGYLLSKESIPVVIDKNYQNSTEPLATLVNQVKRLSYIKVDTSRKPLPGVVFDLIRADTGEIVESVTSNEWGEFIFTRFDYGEWIIREVAAPEGFNRMDDLYLVVDEGWVEPEPIFLVNIPNHYEFVKTDHEGNPMAGVKFTLEDAQGNILRDLVSGEDGVVHVTDLAPGSYTIREIETLEGFTRTEETIQVTISEQYIVPDEMFCLVNYPIIQTGVDADLNLWAGAVLGSLSLLSLLAFAILTRRRPRT